MSKNTTAVIVKHATVDLFIIIATTLLSISIYVVFNDQIVQFIKEGNESVLLRLFSIAVLQYGGAGLGITIICILRKEPFTKFGLCRKNVLTAILYSCLMYIPNIAITLAYQVWQGYYPFQSVWTTKEILSSSLPIAIVGMIITAVSWGFFEGFNYAVITDKINSCLPAKHWLLDWGAIICTVMCILIHGMVGITPKDILEAFSVILIIYGSLMVRKKTGNSWGIVFTFIFLWNAY
ncbi:MAG: hypothetical protein PHU23_15185 [Dehalococcoidales bacterium]|nr:hypothetical protein [Dehalococcoidales bacterium]